MKEVVIVSAARTAVGSFGGSLKSLSAIDLGAVVLSEALKRAHNPNLDEVIMGQVLTAGQGQGPARQAAMRAGIPQETPALTINKICGSGIKSIMLAAQAIKAGDAECIAAGGMESMSNAPYVSFDMRWGSRMGHMRNIDTMISDGLWEVFNNYHMGITAENLAEHYSISREEQDAFALNSQHKALAAIGSGVFKDEIVPVTIKNKKGDAVVADVDEHPRSDASIEALGKLKPAFKPDGTVTAGNASGINDGAAAVVLMSAEAAKRSGLVPLARIVAYATAGVNPQIMGIGPVPATRHVLQKSGWTMDDLDLIEGNEAFAAQILAVNRELKFPEDKLNVNGGAIALGHPIGASGARLLVTLLYSLKNRNKKRGLATLCIGGGMGAAMLVERT